jgi:hypothetical protein
MHDVHLMRRRNGAFHWNLRELPASDGFVAMIESFHFPTWLDRVRSHDRTTKLDASVEDQVVALHVGPTPPTMRHASDTAVTECCSASAFFTRARDTFLNGVARELPRLFDRLHNARRYGWDGKARPW